MLSRQNRKVLLNLQESNLHQLQRLLSAVTRKSNRLPSRRPLNFESMFELNALKYLHQAAKMIGEFTALSIGKIHLTLSVGISASFLLYNSRRCLIYFGDEKKTGRPSCMTFIISHGIMIDSNLMTLEC
mmetsp:Transcript_2857/g.4098  ORF Transcript_2857/g.4098 Transcript_2857/m.4098 type:complete len:129 (+) Transcript_2857:477-863(+)